MRFVRVVLIVSILPVVLIPCTGQTTNYKDYSVIQANERKVAKYCSNSFDVIDCNMKCEDHPQLKVPPKEGRFHEHEYEHAKLVFYQDSLELERKVDAAAKNHSILSSRPGVGIPCSNKCESDPKYWSCVEECYQRDFTKLWTAQCFNGTAYNGSKICSTSLSSTKCFSCLEKATKKQLWKLCDILYLPNLPQSAAASGENLCEKLSTCDSSTGFSSHTQNVTIPGNMTLTNSTQNQPSRLLKTLQTCFKKSRDYTQPLEVMRVCVNQKIFSAQRSCCSSEVIRQAFGCRNGSIKDKCSRLCSNLLPPNLCQEKCKKLRDPRVLRCFETCDFNHPKTQDYYCIDNCPSGSGSPFVPKNNSAATRLAISTCHNYDLFQQMIDFESEAYQTKWNNLEGEGLWMNYHWTPLECREDSSNITCRDQVLKHRSPDEIEAQCRANPYRLLDMFICANSLQIFSLQLDVILELLPEFYKENCMNETLRALYTHEWDVHGHYSTCVDCDDQYPTSISDILNWRCRVDVCQQTGVSRHCPPLEDGHVVELDQFSTCRWVVDLAKSQNPYVLWGTYFNELPPTEIKHKLEHPDTTYILPETVYDNRMSLFTFPYFVVVRGVCDIGGYYGSGGYKFFMAGDTPTVQLRYRPFTTRHSPTGFIIAELQSALIKLQRLKNDELILENPLSINGSNELGCHERICYPGFAVPLIYLQIPSFGVKVRAQEQYADHQIQVYISAFHSRSSEGKGEIQIAEGVFPGHPGLLFPKERSSFATDTEMNEHADCIGTAFIGSSQNGTGAQVIPRRTCPEIEHLTNDLDNPYVRNIFDPLDSDDILRAQYTFGTSPIKAIAGFYDPRLMILGDPDMQNFEVVNWGNLLKELEEDNRFHSCVQNHVHRGHKKPIYSSIDRTDPIYPIKYYRQRYFPMKFETEPDVYKRKAKKEYADTAIFEAIGLEDRVLLITTKGLVPFYGHMNSTVANDNAWKYFEDEIVNRCFKIVRILPSGQPVSDTIVGITYDYVVKNTLDTGNSYKEISQEIWIGKLLEAGDRLRWKKLTVPQPNTQDKKGRIDAGAPIKVDSARKPGIPFDYSKATPKSQVEAICFKAFIAHIAKFSKNIQLYPDKGWCEAVDATPVQMRQLTIQVLVRMRAYYDPGGKPENIYFYILAGYTVSFSKTSEIIWRVNTVIPRMPCVDEHFESIKSVLVFDEGFFQKSSAHSNQGRDYVGCHELYKHRVDCHIFLHGMSYARTFTNHLFLYGSRLLHSTNNGKTFAFLKSFPQKFQDTQRFTRRLNLSEDSYNQPRTNHLHRIIRMAFDSTGHYAFLTNKLELWLGTTGATDQILLRPSPLQSMVQLGISKVKNIMDGVPFAIDFDVNNKLYEMVAVLDKHGVVSRVLKRPVDVWSILRVKTLLAKLNEYSMTLIATRKLKKTLTGKLQTPNQYKPSEWATFCPYASPTLSQNYSVVHSRSQTLKFLHPKQHLFIGSTHTEASLLAYQAITFHVTWNNLFDPPVRLYSGVDKDPFQVWTFRKRFETATGELRFKQAVPNKDYGIILQPHLYKRLDLNQPHSILITNYYLDYGLIAEMRLEFSVKNDYSLTHVAFEADHTNQVQLNIENANGTLIILNTEKEVFADRASVLFIIRMHLNKKIALGQQRPGENFIPVPVIYHLIGAFGNCIDYKHDGVIGDRIQTVAYVGCPTGKDLVFDWNKTLDSIQLRGDKVPKQERMKHGVGDLCYQGTFACFFSRKPMVMHFQIFDEPTQTFRPYTGKYTFRVIGGGRTWDDLDVYSREQVEAFNMPGVSDVSLVWSEWDPLNHQKITRKMQNPGVDYGIDFDSREVILDAGKTSITWSCHTLSPCARVAPTSNLEVVYWFRVFVSNRYVEKDTLCLFEKEFDIMLYGFQPSPEYQLLTTLGFAFLMIGILYVLFLCCRREKKLWEETKRNTKTWLHIVRDTIPKKLRIYEPPLGEDLPPKEVRKFRLLGSPDLSRDSFSSLEHDLDASPNMDVSSSSLLAGSSTHTPSTQVLPGVGMLGKTKTEIVYDQLLQKKLNSIVERNRALRKNLLKKASLHSLGEDLELESRFAKQFGRTVSTESLFTPPMPKEKKGVTGTFF